MHEHSAKQSDVLSQHFTRIYEETKVENVGSEQHVLNQDDTEELSEGHSQSSEFFNLENEQGKDHGNPAHPLSKNATSSKASKLFTSVQQAVC